MVGKSDCSTPCRAKNIILGVMNASMRAMIVMRVIIIIMMGLFRRGATRIHYVGLC